MISPALPDIQAGMIAFFMGKTTAQNNVLDLPKRATKPPYLLITWEGDIQEQHNTVMPTARITTDAFGRTPRQARYIARQIREALLTPGDATGGVTAQVSYYDEEEERDRTINLSGARLESGPREGPEEPERIITTYLVTYY
jgi:hypothetical protein